MWLWEISAETSRFALKLSTGEELRIRCVCISKQTRGVGSGAPSTPGVLSLIGELAFVGGVAGG